MKIRSKSIAEVSYEPSQELLDVYLNSGTLYRYYHVPPSAYHELIRSSAAGQYYRERIRHVYSYRRFPSGVPTD